MRKILLGLVTVLSLSGEVLAQPGPRPPVSQVVGTWTPSDQSGAALTFSGVSVNYTQTGNWVCVYGRLSYPVTANGNGASIGGLPVTSANANYALGAGSMVQTNVLTYSLVPQMQVNATKFNISNGFSGAAVTNVALSGSTIVFNFCYPAA